MDNAVLLHDRPLVIADSLPSRKSTSTLMSFISQLNDLGTVLRTTRSRLFTPAPTGPVHLPRDPEVFVEDVLHYMMDQWAMDLKAEGHVLEQDHGWKDPVSQYPLYTLRMMGSEPLHLHFTGIYPEALFLSISKAFRSSTRFSDAKHLMVELPISNDPNHLLHGLIDGIKRYGKVG